MNIKKLLFNLLLIAFMNNTFAQENFEIDTLKTDKGNVEISFIGHGSLMLKYDEKIIHVDPFSKLRDYSNLPKADLVLITHEHGDHLDKAALEAIVKSGTTIILTEKCKENAPELKNVVVMKNGDKQKQLGIKIEAVPAYNIVNQRDNGQPFHPKGQGNGYILKISEKRIYIAGDTENTPEMKALKKIDVAFLPMNLPYTMTPEMVADAARAFKPKILYPYHYGKTDINKLLESMQDEKSVEIRIRKME